MRLLQFKPKSDPNAAARVGALIAGGKAILDLPSTLDGAGRGGWLPPSGSCEWWNLDGSGCGCGRFATQSNRCKHSGKPGAG